MQPNSHEIGLILEQPDIEVANTVRAVVWEKFESGKSNPQLSPLKTPLQPNEDGVLELDEAAARHMVNYASVACRETRFLYQKQDKKFDSLMEAQLFDSEEYIKLEGMLPQLENQIRLFGSFATSAEACISQSQMMISSEQL